MKRKKERKKKIEKKRKANNFYSYRKNLLAIERKKLDNKKDRRIEG